MKYIVQILLFTFVISSAKDIDLTFEYDGIERELAIQIPDDYNASNSYELLIGLHGCGQNAFSYRTALSDVAYDKNLILVCINALDDGSQLNKMMVDERGKVIPAAIEYLSEQYNIDENGVYLTGFSCNGAMTLFHGLNDIYNFKGLIPFNAYLPPEYDGKYNLESKKATCFCSGTNDGNYSRNQSLYNQLNTNGGVTFFNSMPGIGHTVNFNGFTDEMQECINFINQTTTDIESEDSGILIYPNIENGIIIIETENKIQITKIYNLLGELIISSDQRQIKISELNKGIYFINVLTSNSIISRKLVI
jgi:predicted esterase